MIDKRINFRYGGDTMGGPNDKSNDQGETSSDSGFSDNSSNNTNNTNSGNNDYNFTGPADLGVTTRTVDRITAPPAQEYVGNIGNDNQTVSTPQVNTLVAEPKKFNMLSFLGNTALFAFNPALALKYRKAKGMYDTAKYVTSIFDPMTTKNLNKPFEIIENLTKNIGLKDKNVVQSFKDSLTSNLTPKSKPVINTNTRNDDNGIGTLENANVLQDEYTLLLQKLQTGNITDEERVRYTMLKNMLGI